MDANLLYAELNDLVEEYNEHKQFLDAISEDSAVGVVEFRVKQVIEMIPVVRAKYNQLKRIVGENDKPKVEQCFARFGATCYDLVGSKQEWLRKKRLPPLEAVQANVHRPRVKFPTITLPVFNGELENWIEFRDRFESLVNRNSDLSKIDKFNYLLSGVQLPPGQQSVLQNFRLSEETYEEAWKAVCDRYDDKRKLKSQHFDSALSVKKMSTESSAELRRLLDSFASSFTALDLLGTSQDDFRVHIVQQSLDEQTLKDWRKWIDDDEPTWPKMKEFLTKQWRTLDSVPQKPAHQMHQADDNDTAETISPASTFTASSATLRCHWCQEPHMLYQCAKFLAASAQEREKFVVDSKLCKICFSPSHNIHQCRYASSRQCTECKGMHNVLIHRESHPTNHQQPPVKVLHGQTFPPVHPHLNVTSPAFHPHSPVNAWSEGGNVNHVSISSLPPIDASSITLLQTVNVRVADKTGKFHECRALIDGGSQHNLITESFARRLALPIRSAHQQLNGIDGAKSIVREKAAVFVASRYTAFTKIIECSILPRITGKLPHRQAQILHSSIPENLFLADPSFHLPADVDLLLGIDMRNEVLLSETHRIPEGPMLQHTKLGWTFGGTIRTSASAQPPMSYTHFCSTATTIASDEKAEQLKSASQFRLHNHPQSCDTVQVDDSSTVKLHTNTKANENRSLCSNPFDIVLAPTPGQVDHRKPDHHRHQKRMLQAGSAEKRKHDKKIVFKRKESRWTDRTTTRKGHHSVTTPTKGHQPMTRSVHDAIIATPPCRTKCRSLRSSVLTGSSIEDSALIPTCSKSHRQHDDTKNFSQESSSLPVDFRAPSKLKNRHQQLKVSKRNFPLRSNITHSIITTKIAALQPGSLQEENIGRSRSQKPTDVHATYNRFCMPPATKTITSPYNRLR
jgi:Protein of unknown function (DUF1759)/Putative peptidase (DUF1758)